jgi:hypothetical protein
MTTVACSLQQHQQDRTSEPSLPDMPDVGARLLELAGAYTRQALAFPDELAIMRTLLAEAMFEIGVLRARVERLEARS